MTVDTTAPNPDREAPRLLADYDSDTHGPLFAVSDEGSAGRIVLDAAYASAKAQALPLVDPFALGVILDGERMTSAGEVPIGPPEYAALSTAAAGRLLLTTNVGVRVNARLLQQLPEFIVPNAGPTDSWCDEVCEAFGPFLDTPDHQPRPLTARLGLAVDAPPGALSSAVEKLETRRAKGKLGPAELHRFAALMVYENEITAEDQFRQIEAIMQAAAKAKLAEVAVDGALREAARKRLGAQSLLNVLEVDILRRLLAKSSELGVRLVYRYQFDAESAARTIWTGLETARAHGFTAGKYGLFPLALEEQARVIELLTRWTAGWTAIPAFYVDTALLTATDVYDDTRCVDGARQWLRVARGAGATVVLFDCPDRVDPRRLLKSQGEKGPGVLTIDEVEQLTAYAKGLGVSILWSGGITSPQAFELAQRKVFGIFSTSSTAAKIAVTAAFAADPRLPSENEPTEFGVRRMHAIVQGGFLAVALGEKDKRRAKSIESATRRLLKAEADAGKSEDELRRLNTELSTGWRALWGAPEHDSVRGQRPGSRPVPPDAVRVFRGRRREAIKHEEFINKLGKLFMPVTVQMQRIYGLTAYLPAVLPASKPAGLPDEIALVFYRTQGTYHEAKQCVGGRAYGELHDLVFDMANSPSEFPQLFTDEVKPGRAYYLFERSVDWQTGYARLYVGTRRKRVNDKAFLEDVGKLAAGLRKAPEGRDAAIFCAGKDWLAWWEHSPEPAESPSGVADLIEQVFQESPRLLRVPDSLTEPYLGLALDTNGDFINFQFQRV